MHVVFCSHPIQHDLSRMEVDIISFNIYKIFSCRVPVTDGFLHIIDVCNMLMTWSVLSLALNNLLGNVVRLRS